MTTAQATKKFEMVAVSEPKASPSEASRYALGVRSASDNAAYTVGGDGPAHMPVEKLYFTAGEQEFAIDVNAKTLTVAEKATMRVVVIPIDIEAMSGHIIEQGETFTVVIADAARTEQSVKVGRWVAATAPTFERDTLPHFVTAAEGIAVSIDNTVQQAERAGNVKVQQFASTPAAETSAVVDIRTEPETESPLPEIKTGELLDISEHDELDGEVEDNFDNDESMEVVAPDPLSGARYKARQWCKNLAKKDALTLLRLRNHGFRVVIMEMENDQSATIALNDPKGLPVMSITTNGKPAKEFYLTEKTWSQRFGPTDSFQFGVDSALDGSAVPNHTKTLSTSAITRITATSDLLRGKELAHASKGTVTDALANHRRHIAARGTKNRESLVRNFSHRDLAR